MVVFEALTWHAKDEDGEHMITIFGRAENGKSVSVTTGFNPYFFIKLPIKSTDPSVRLLFDKICKVCGDDCPIRFDILKAKDLWGFQNNEKCPFMKLEFSSLVAM